MQTSGRNPFKSGTGRSRTRVLHEILAFAVLTAGLALLQGCNGNVDPAYGNPTANNPTPGVTLQAIQIAPSTSLISMAEQRQLTAVGVYSDGSTKDLTASANWLSATQSVATINISGLATAVAVGTSSISASSGGISSSTTLTVT